MTSSYQKIYDYILYNLNNYDCVCVTNQIISDNTNVSIRCISIGIKYLIDNNYLNAINIGGKVKVYILPNTDIDKQYMNCNLVMY